jgi:2-keto-4-pentenoate hydratase
MVGRCDKLRAGDTIFLGGLTQTRWLNVDDQVSFEMGGLGRVEFSVVE